MLDAAKNEAALIWMQPKGEKEIIYLHEGERKREYG